MDAPKLLSVIFHDIQSLNLAYMPFLLGGGIFLPEAEGYSLGQEVFLLLELPESADKIPVSGKVAWITPASNFIKKPKGVGFGFQGTDTLAKSRIENILSGQVGQATTSLTM